jgi:hypothetical protein
MHIDLLFCGFFSGENKAMYMRDKATQPISYGTV